MILHNDTNLNLVILCEDEGEVHIFLRLFHSILTYPYAH